MQIEQQDFAPYFTVKHLGDFVHIQANRYREGSPMPYASRSMILPEEYEEPFRELAQLTFVLFGDVKVLVMVGRKFYESDKYKQLKWWQRWRIRVTFALQGILKK